MREISRPKKLEVAPYYILGYPYSDIENRTEVSHGSVVNIVKGLEPSQALLGLLLFDRLRALEATPELVDRRSGLVTKLFPVDFPFEIWNRSIPAIKLTYNNVLETCFDNLFCIVISQIM